MLSLDSSAWPWNFEAEVSYRKATNPIRGKTVLLIEETPNCILLHDVTPIWRCSHFLVLHSLDLLFLRFSFIGVAFLSCVFIGDQR